MLNEYFQNKLDEAYELIQNDTELALNIFNELLEQEPENIEVLNGKGSALMKLNKIDEADECFNQSILVSENPSALINKGLISKQRNEYSKALKYYDSAIQLDSNLNNIVSILKNEIMDLIDDTILSIDEFAPEAPRIVLSSKNGHSRISISQISLDFTVNFDGEFLNSFELTRDYIIKRVELIVKLLGSINIEEYLFCGISYNMRMDIGECSPLEYIGRFLCSEFSDEHLYEASQNIAKVKDEKFFINQQIGTYKEVRGKTRAVANVLDVLEEKPISEGVSLVLDINNRYQYTYKGIMSPMSECKKEVEGLFGLMCGCIQEWSKR